MAAGCPKSASKTDFGPILVDFGSIFDEFLMLLPLFLLALKRELGIEVGLLFRYRGYWCVLPSCVISLTIHSQNPFIEARWRRWPEGQLDKNDNNNNINNPNNHNPTSPLGYRWFRACVQPPTSNSTSNFLQLSWRSGLPLLPPPPLAPKSWCQIHP